MRPEIAALIAAVIAAVASLLSLYINSKLTLTRERRQQLWQYDLEQIRGVEQLAGRIIQLIEGYPATDELDDLYPKLISEFEVSMGRLLRYHDLNQAMRDVYNAAQQVVDSLRHYEDPWSDRKDLNNAFNRLVGACDAVLKRK